MKKKCPKKINQTGNLEKFGKNKHFFVYFVAMMDVGVGMGKKTAEIALIF